MVVELFAAIHVLLPYLLVAFIAMLLYRLIQRHEDDVTRIHSRTLDVFERQNATYERIVNGLADARRTDVVDLDVTPTVLRPPPQAR